MTAPVYGVGDQSILGWATETTPGTPVAPAHYIPAEIGSSSPDFDPNRMPVEVMGGSPFVTIAVVDRKGKGTWSVKFEVFPVLAQDFLTACGLTSTGIVAPSSLTLTQDYQAKSIKYPGCRCTKMVIESSADKGLTVTVSGVFTGRPVVGTALSVPTWAGEDPFIYTDLGQVTLISGASTASDLESFMITIDMPHAEGYGNSGVPLPSILKLSKVNITGRLVVFFNDTNVAEYNAMIVSGGTAGEIIIPFTKVTPSHTATFDILNAKYSKGPLTAPKDGLDLLSLDFTAFSPTLTNYMTYTVA